MFIDENVIEGKKSILTLLFRAIGAAATISPMVFHSYIPSIIYSYRRNDFLLAWDIPFYVLTLDAAWIIEG